VNAAQRNNFIRLYVRLHKTQPAKKKDTGAHTIELQARLLLRVGHSLHAVSLMLKQSMGCNIALPWRQLIQVLAAQTLEATSSLATRLAVNPELANSFASSDWAHNQRMGPT